MKKLTYFVLPIAIFAANYVFSENNSSTSTQPSIVKLTPSHFKPAFTKQTVKKLNMIVSNQLGVINEYDEIVDGVSDIVEKFENRRETKDRESLRASVAKIDALSARSKKNLKDMIGAEKALIASGESYNKAIFAGMMDFVSDVEREISLQNKRLIDALKGV